MKWFSACNRKLIVEIMCYIFVCNKCMDHFCIFYVFVFFFTAAREHRNRLHLCDMAEMLFDFKKDSQDYLMVN